MKGFKCNRYFVCHMSEPKNVSKNRGRNGNTCKASPKFCKNLMNVYVYVYIAIEIKVK